MKLVIFNGSPRNKNSNSKILIDKFLEGYSKTAKDPVPIHYLAETQKSETFKRVFLEAETAILIFPLYTDCMPGIVKLFFEELITLEIKKPKKIGFIVQSGFPEAIHSVYIERYLRKLILRLNCINLGTIIKGGVEGIKIMPSSMTKNLYQNFFALGKIFAETESFDDEIKDNLKKPFKLSVVRRGFFRVLSVTGITNFYWNMNLKKNNAYTKRFDRPYAA